jgi:uncharacterized protein YggE
MLPARRIIPFACLVLPALAPATAAQAPGATQLSEVVSAASAERPVRADLATLTLRFSRLGRTPAEAGRNLALKADSLRRALAAVGIARDSIVSGSRWYWWPQRIEMVVTEGRREMVADTGADGRIIGSHQVVHPDTSYRSQESLRVRIRDLSRVGQVIDAALAQGVIDISEVEFFATETETAQREAIREATERARARAEVIASAGGGRLGRTLRLSTEGGGEPSQRVLFGGLTVAAMGTAEGQGGAGGGQTVIVAPVLQVRATVNGRWEFVEGR